METFALLRESRFLRRRKKNRPKTSAQPASTPETAIPPIAALEMELEVSILALRIGETHVFHQVTALR
jgi:hypothetical protein